MENPTMTFASTAAAMFNGGEGNYTHTLNGALTNLTSQSANLDFFSQAAAMRNTRTKAEQLFYVALAENEDLALRTLLWLRDIRGGAGERDTFRHILASLSLSRPGLAAKVALKTPLVGRWDDLLVMPGDLRPFALSIIEAALLEDDNALAAKWMPRKGPDAEALRAHLRMSPYQYRKLLVNLSKTVEQQMSAKDWENINFSHVPSLAAKKYQKAFAKRAPVAYSAYREALKTGAAKISASAIFPHDVISGLSRGLEDVTSAQWKALPDYFNGASANMLPLIDVSGSMTQQLSFGSRTSALDVAIGLGIYIAERQKGAFQNLVMTYSSTARVVTLSESMTLPAKVAAVNDGYAGSTNLEAALLKILEIATQGNIPASEMPEKILIISDMEFDCSCNGARLVDAAKERFAAAGYVAPQIVFWNVMAHGRNSPATTADKDVHLVGGYSPSILKSLLKGGSCPVQTMLDTVMIDRYDVG